MIDRIAKLFGIKNFSSEDTLKKGLEKINPKFKSFFEKASKAGYPLGATLGFLQSQFVKSPKGEMTSRPDIAANRSIENQSRLPGQIAGSIGKAALGAATGGIGGAVLGALGSGNQEQNQDQNQQQQQPQQQIPQDKVEERPLSPMSADINAQIQAAKFRGGAPSDMSQRINEQMKESQQEQRQFDPLAGFSEYPELTRFIQTEFSKGGNAQSIGSKARKTAKLLPMVEKIEKKAGEEFESLLERILGGYGKQRSTQPMQQEPSPKMAQFLQALQQLRQMSGG